MEVIMAVKILKVVYKGKTPLIMHNGQASSPLDDRKLPTGVTFPGHTLIRTATKALSSKRDKSERDHELLGKIGFFSSLYLNLKEQVVVPADCIQASLLEQAKANKWGLLIKRGVSVIEDSLLEFPDKGKKVASLYPKYAYTTMVAVQRAKTLRTRAMFQDWSFETQIEYVPKIIDEQRLLDILSLGEYYGFLERRPKFGRYTVKVLRK